MINVVPPFNAVPYYCMRNMAKYFYFVMPEILKYAAGQQQNILSKTHVQEILVTFYSNIYPTRCNITHFILSGNCSICFGWDHHPSQGAQTAVSTASVSCHTVMDRVKFTDKVYIKNGLELRLLLIMCCCGKCSMYY